MVWWEVSTVINEVGLNGFCWCWFSPEQVQSLEHFIAKCVLNNDALKSKLHSLLWPQGDIGPQGLPGNYTDQHRQPVTVINNNACFFFCFFYPHMCSDNIFNKTFPDNILNHFRDFVDYQVTKEKEEIWYVITH